MGKYFPPSLQARGTAIKGGQPGSYNISGNTEIFFNMPAQNDVTSLFGLDGSNGGHVQFTLKTKSNNTTVFNTTYTPDYVTVYFNAKTNYSPDSNVPLANKMAQIVHYDADLYSLVISNMLYKNPHKEVEVGPIADTDYTIQIRFGDRELSEANQWYPYSTEFDGLQLNFTGFASWRANAIARSEFGEWSNTQTFYAYGPYTATLKADVNKWLPTFTFEYSTQYKDEITSIEVRCQYILPSGEVRTESENFSGDLGTPGYFKITRSVNIAPTDTLYVQVIPITQHGTIINDPVYMTYAPANPSTNGIAFGPYSNTTYPNGKIDDGDPTLPLGDIGREPLLVTEERKDGVIAKRILSPVIANSSLNIYRFDYFTREAVLIASGIDLSAGATPYIFKDYCVEMGTQYQYAGVVQNNRGQEGVMLWEMFSPYASGSNPFAELDKLEFSVLTAKDCQLRFQGNPTVSNFKREVQESFQTTIGDEYPFYSRVGKSNYRTLSFSGVVSINFDFTSLFLELDSTNPSYEKRGLLWEKNLIVPIEKVYDQQQISLNRRRFNINNPFIASTAETNNTSGPGTIHDERLLASRKKKYNTQQTSDMIYLERRFREKAMSWLSNGKPKLFRSETEGNMIVIASGVSFTPLQGSQRMVYTAQMTLTEIAAHNLTNLLKYNLLPCEIVADIESPLTEYLGDYDPNYSDGVLRFPDSDSYDIVGVQNGRPIDPILIAYEPGLRVTGGMLQQTSGTPRYTFDIVEPGFETTYNLRWEQISRNGVECLRLYGIPFSNMAPRAFTARVKDGAATVATIQFQFGGSSSSGSVFSIDTIPSVTYNGNAQTPSIIVRENGIAITPTSIVYSDNTNAGIATVTVTLPTGGTLVKSFNILQKIISATQGTVNIEKIYDGSVSSAGATITGNPTTDINISPLTIAVTPGQFTAKGVGTSKAITVGLTIQGIGASNYALSSTSAIWTVGTIIKKSIAIVPNAGQSRIYGTTDPVLTYTVSPALIAGDTMGGLLSRAPGTTIGTYAISLGTLSAGLNYDITFASGVLFTITKASAPTLNWPQSTPIMYGQALSVAMAPTTNIYGTFRWNTPSTIPTVINDGYPVTFTPLDSVNYDWPASLTQTVAVQVSPKQLVLNGVTAPDKVYDRTVDVAITSGTLTGIVGTDVVSVVTGQATTNNKNIGTNKPVSFAVSLNGAAASNYTVVLGSVVTVNIAPKLVTIVSAIGQDRSYNGFQNVNVEVIISGIISGDNVQLEYLTVGEITSPMPAGNVPVTTALTLIGTDKNNYSVPTVTATVNITKAAQAPPQTPTLQTYTINTVVVATDASQEYSIDGGVNWQSSGVFTGLSPLTLYSIVGRYKETNIFAVSMPSLPRIITTEALTITYTITGFSDDYDGQQHGVTYTLEPTATIRFSADSGATYDLLTSPTYKDVGTYTVFYKVSKPGAHDIVSTQQLIIDVRRTTVVADNKAKALGQPDPILTYTVNPALISGDSFTGTLSRIAGETAGNYQIMQGTLSLSANYLIEFTPGTLNVAGDIVTITPTSGQNKVFQDTDPVLTYTFTPALQTGDSFTGQLSRSTGEDVGTYNILMGTLSAPTSYALILNPAVFTITKKPITITAEAKSKVFGENDPTLTYTTSPSTTDAFTGSLTRAVGQNVGTYPITKGSLDNLNYNITFSGNVLTINRASITRTYESYVNTHEYTGSPIQPNIQLIDSLTSELLVENTDYSLSYLNNTNVGMATVTVTGINNYQLSKNLNFQITPVITTLTVEAIGDIDYTGYAITPLPVVKNGTAILMLDTDYTVSYANNREVGTATVIVTGVNSYSGNSVTGHFDIRKATYTSTITNTAALSRVFSPIANPPTPTVNNNPGGGAITTYYATSIGGTYTTTVPLNAGSYYAKVSIAATENYLLVETAPVAFTISPLATTFTTFSTPSGLTITYDGNSYSAGVPSILGTALVKNSDYTLSPDNTVTNAGTHTWTYTGIGNYVGSTGNFILVINPYPVTIQLLGASPKLYGAVDPTFNYNSTALIGSDTLTGTPGRALGENAGNYTLTLGTLSGGVNYQLTVAASSATVFTISPRGLATYAPDWTSGDITPTAFSHTGSPVTPIIEDWNSSIVPIVGIDIQYSYSTNIDIGNAQATVSALNGNFTGNLTFNFQIQ